MEELLSKGKEVDSLKATASEKDSLIEKLNADIADKAACIEKLNADLADKAACIEKLNDTIQAQGEEISEAQEKFKQLLSTIENELGTEFPVEHTFDNAAPAEPAPAEAAPAAEPVVEAEAEPVVETAAEEPAAEPAAEDVPDEEPVLDFNQIAEDEDLPIEVHGANEKDNDLFSASNGGSQTNFFG